MVVADKGNDSEKLREFIRDNNATLVIPRKNKSLVGNEACTNIGTWLRMHLVVLNNIEG